MSNTGLMIDPEWLQTRQCPACGSGTYRDLGSLAVPCYRFMGQRIEHPAGGISLRGCGDCGLVYKDRIPGRALLMKVTERGKAQAWRNHYHFAPELRLIESLVGRRPYDLLDIGAAHGDLLRAAGPGPGRRSGMDIVKFADLDDAITGEFISGFLDTPDLEWSGEPYDVVTVFDVLEHQGDARQAFDTLRQLVKPGGYVVLETGDHDALEVEGRLKDCSYTNLFDHTVFWNRQSLERMAERAGFDLVSHCKKRHKLMPETSLSANLAPFLKYALYRWARPLFFQLQGGRRAGFVPGDPFREDHMGVVLRRRLWPSQVQGTMAPSAWYRSRVVPSVSGWSGRDGGLPQA